MNFTVETASAEETENLGRRFGTFLSSGSVIALFGDLGGGKTCFTRGVVASIVPENAHMVTSPTFAIMNEYQGRQPVYHFDFYRLHGSNDIYELGFDDYFNGDGISIIEWAERLGDQLPEQCISIHFEYLGDTSRRLKFNAAGKDASKDLFNFQSALAP